MVIFCPLSSVIMWCWMLTLLTAFYRLETSCTGNFIFCNMQDGTLVRQRIEKAFNDWKERGNMETCYCHRERCCAVTCCAWYCTTTYYVIFHLSPSSSTWALLILCSFWQIDYRKGYEKITTLKFSQASCCSTFSGAVMTVRMLNVCFNRYLKTLHTCPSLSIETALANSRSLLHDKCI